MEMACRRLEFMERGPDQGCNWESLEQMISTATGLDEHSEGESAPRGGGGPRTEPGSPTGHQEEPATEKAKTSGGRRKPVEGEVSKWRMCFEKEVEIAHQPRLLGGG